MQWIKQMSETDLAWDWLPVVFECLIKDTWWAGCSSTEASVQPVCKSWVFKSINLNKNLDMTNADMSWSSKMWIDLTFFVQKPFPKSFFLRTLPCLPVSYLPSSILICFLPRIWSWCVLFLSKCSSFWDHHHRYHPLADLFPRKHDLRASGWPVSNEYIQSDWCAGVYGPRVLGIVDDLL